jgi:predicted Rossmann fold flavoprotein
MCAIEAGKRGRSVLVLDHANKVGKKILLSGGGRCNFTNCYASPGNYFSDNPHFCISALKRFTQFDFEALVQKHGVGYHEKTLGQLFCNESAKDILNLLLKECEQAKVEIRLDTQVSVTAGSDEFQLSTAAGSMMHCKSLVIATGGLSFPTMGASPFGYQVAEQFGLKVLPVRAGLVPLTLHCKDLEILAPLSGLSLSVEVSVKGQSFREAMLFTHRGLSGPAILQISSYWHPGEVLHINLLPDEDALEFLKAKRALRPKAELKAILAGVFPLRFAEALCAHWLLPAKSINQYSEKELAHVASTLSDWQIIPNGTEGYRTAEVTLGGVDTHAISSKTFEAIKVPRLYFIGEVLDVTGHLGGFNFQWAWASGYCAGQFV